MGTISDISLQTVVSAIDDQVSCELADEVVVLSLQSGAYYGLNAVAARVWALLQAPNSVADLRDMLLEEFAIEAEECTAELRALLMELIGMELVRVH